MTRLGPYEVLGELGRGASGVVLRGRDPAGRAVALKLLASALDPRQTERLRREGILAGRLSHPGIAAVRELLSLDDGRLVLVSELVEGRTLDAASRTLPRAARVELVRQVVAAMAHAHANGVVHRDLKPANILVATGTGSAKVIDFGLATAQDVDRMTRTGTLIGTPSHMAPEQLRGEPAGPPADVWALGVLLHEALVGRPPFEASGFLELMAQVTGQDVEPLADPDVPAALEAVALRALSREPAGRFADAGQLAAALDEAASSAPRPPRSAGAHVARAALVLVLVGLGLVAAKELGRGLDPPPTQPAGPGGPADGPAAWLAEATALAAPRPGRTTCEAAADPAAAVDARGAITALERAESRGSLEAARRLARALDEGWGAPSDPGAALRLALRAAEGGDGPAMAHVARLLELGRGAASDPEQARRWRARALGALRARASEPAWRVALGRLLACDPPVVGELGEWVEEPDTLRDQGLELLRAAVADPAGGPLDLRRADPEAVAALGVGLRRARRSGSDEALLEVAAGLWGGRVAVERARCSPDDPAGAVRWLERALALDEGRLGEAERADLRCELGERLLQAPDLGRGAEGRVQLAEVAGRGHARAALTLARACRDGVGGPRSLADALRWAASAVARCDLMEQVEAEGLAAELDSPAARAELAAQAAAGRPAADHLLGAVLERSQDAAVPRARVIAAAAVAYRRAIAAGFEPSRWALGLMLFAAGPEEALTYLEPLVAAGDARALRILGLAQATGRGAPRDDLAARETLGRARAGGDSLAGLFLARLLHAGRGGPRDDAAALELLPWARPGLEKPGGVGHLRILARLGAELEGLRGGAAAQLRWLRLGVTHGDPDAMRALGQRLLDGEGAPSDPAAGRRLLERAARTPALRDADPLAGS